MKHTVSNARQLAYYLDMQNLGYEELRRVANTKTVPTHRMAFKKAADVPAFDPYRFAAGKKWENFE